MRSQFIAKIVRILSALSPPTRSVCRRLDFQVGDKRQINDVEGIVGLINGDRAPLGAGI